MKYEMIGSTTTLSISAVAFADICDANDGLSSLLRIEMDYDILIGNWLQLEKTAMSLSLEWFARWRFTRSDVDRDHTELNRNIVNLLSSARGFQDHAKRLASLRGSTEADKKILRHLFTAQSDASLSYKVTNTLRNYSQHYGLPTQGFRVERHATGETEHRQVATNVCAYLVINELRSYKDFDKSILDELEATKGNDVPVMPLLRDYISSLSEIMDGLRQLYRDRRDAWSNTLDKWVRHYCQAASVSEGTVTSVAAVKINDNEEIGREVHLTGVQLRERIAALQEANRRLLHLDRLQVVM